jgi:hypothetical protein
MRLYHLIWLAGLRAILAVIPAFAATDGTQVQGRAEISLANYDVVIADTGDVPEGWSASPTHVYLQVLDGRDARDMYFDSLPAAVFVLRELYGTPRILQLLVPEYNSPQQQGGQGSVWIDGLQAYYIWDAQRFCRGNLPLVLAFSDHRSAVSELLNCEGELLSFENLVLALYSWADHNANRIYWRGRDQQSWDNTIWSQAWNERWTGWSWDYDHGWDCPDGKPEHDGPGHDHPGPGHGGGGNPGPPPGPPPGASVDYHHEHDAGSGGPGNENTHGQDNSGNKQTPRVKDDDVKQTPRVKDDADKPSGGVKGSGDKGNGDKGAGDTGANKPPPPEKGNGNKQAPREKDDAKKPSDGDKGNGGKGSGRVK